MTRSRLAYAFAALCLVAAGLLWRRPDWGLPAFASKYGGSILWGAMVFCLVGCLRPQASIRRNAMAAVLIASVVECSQAVHVGWLDAVRSTVFGRLVLGRTFAWADLVAYGIGIVLACLIASRLFRSTGRG